MGQCGEDGQRRAPAICPEVLEAEASRHHRQDQRVCRLHPHTCSQCPRDKYQLQDAVDVQSVCSGHGPERVVRFLFAIQKTIVL